jgi:hypothetical protein
VAEFTATSGYLGDLTEPGFNRRTERLVGDRNYYQLLASRAIGPRIMATGDYTRLAGVPYARLAVTAGTAPLRVVDTVRLEYYARFGTNDGSGYTVYGEKLLHPRVVIGGGYADIDPLYLPLSGDRFGHGKRLYETVAVRLLPELSAHLFMTQAVNNDFVLSNRRRVDVVLLYNVLGALQRHGWFR